MTSLSIMDGVRTRTLTVKITGVRRYKLRLAIGLRLLKVAIAIIGMKAAVSFDDE